MRLINRILATTAIATLGATYGVGAMAQDTGVSTDSSLGVDAEANVGGDVSAETDMGADSETGASGSGVSDTASAQGGVEAGTQAKAGSDFADLSLEQLMDKPVYDSEEARVGEISDVVVDAQGEITEVIIDIGGFLGIGEKPVAVGIDKLDVVADSSAEAEDSALMGETDGAAGTAMDQTAQADGDAASGSVTADGDFVVYVRMTEAQLEEMPEHQM
ncbi:PRC-barrel domain-containing protein [Pseudooceanicola sp.]|uniref:PRC-barrel domain-containing protein n=1 Tax=Pseudooceanicola sp. TaxID=1914328 RepID=UPI0035C71478